MRSFEMRNTELRQWKNLTPSRENIDPANALARWYNRAADYLERLIDMADRYGILLRIT